MKYYYTDPLAAAWMEKNFGMKIDAELPVQVRPTFLNYSRDGGYDFLRTYKLETGNNLYIHPDSVKLLEPQEGDEGVDKSNSQCEFKNGQWLIDVDLDAVFYANEPVKIDKRNGIPFMWPEVEA